MRSYTDTQVTRKHIHAHTNTRTQTHSNKTHTHKHTYATGARSFALMGGLVGNATMCQCCTHPWCYTHHEIPPRMIVSSISVCRETLPHHHHHHHHPPPPPPPPPIYLYAGKGFFSVFAKRHGSSRVTMRKCYQEV